MAERAAAGRKSARWKFSSKELPESAAPWLDRRSANPPAGPPVSKPVKPSIRSNWATSAGPARGGRPQPDRRVEAVPGAGQPPEASRLMHAVQPVTSCASSSRTWTVPLRRR